MLQDIRHAFRSIRKTPVFTAVVVLTLAVGIGGVTAIAAVAKAMLFRTSPFPQPERNFVVGRFPAAENNILDLSTFFLLRDRFQACEHVGARTGRPGINMVSGGYAEYVRNTLVTAGFFESLGVVPMYGRSFRVDDEQPGSPRIAILDDALAARSFGNPADAIGKSLTLGNQSYEVVGVLPSSLTRDLGVDVWLPLAARRGIQTGLNFTVTCRLRSEGTQQAAATELGTLQSAYAALHADPSMSELAKDRLDLTPFQQLQTRDRRALLGLLGLTVGIVLFIACANSAWLFSARALDRRSEAAVRTALGAGRWRIVRQTLTESVSLTLLGGVLGIGAAVWALPSLLSLQPQGQEWEAEVDVAVLGGSVLLSVFAGALCGLIPAFRHARLDPLEALQTGSRRATSARDATAMRRAMVVTEVALCMVLLVTSGLLIRSLAKLQDLQLGFDARNVLTAQVSMDDVNYRDRQKVSALYDRVLEQIAVLPGVESAAVVTNIPVDRGLNLPIRTPVPINGESIASVDWRYVTEKYFETLRISLRQGRQFTTSDSSSAPHVAIVNDAFVKRFFPDGKPLGYSIELNQMVGLTDARQIVGVVGDTQQRGLINAPPIVYVPIRQVPDALLSPIHGFFPVTWVVRYRTTPDGITQALSAAIRDVDPRLPLSRVRTMEDVVAAALGQTRLQAVLLTVFGGVSVVMAVTALAGTVLYSIMRRRRDIGVRLALGASVPAMLRSIVVENVVLAVGGIIGGVTCAVLLRQSLRPFLFGVTSTDLPTYGAAGALLFCVAVATSVMAAMPVLRIHPADTLKAE